MRRATEFVMVTLLQYVGLMLGTVPDEPIPVWPASGVAIAMLFFRGNRIWPGLWFGGLLAYWVEGLSLQIALCISLVHVIEAMSIRFSVHRIIGALVPMHRSVQVLEFFFLSFGITFLGSGIITALDAPNTFWADPIRIQWFLNWFADFSGVIIFAPACLIWDAYLPGLAEQLRFSHRKMQAYLLGTVFVILNAALLFLNPFDLVYPLSMATIPLIFMAAYYFGQCGATLAAVFTAMIGVCNFETNYQIFKADHYHVYFLSIQCKYCLEAGIAFYLATRKAEHSASFSRFG